MAKYQFKNVTTDDINDILKFGDTNQIKNALRTLREKECYSVVDRACWYDSLSTTQKNEIQEWRKKWLNVTETFVIPKKPSWLI